LPLSHFPMSPFELLGENKNLPVTHTMELPKELPQVMDAAEAKSAHLLLPSPLSSHRQQSWRGWWLSCQLGSTVCQ
jgi:hypothetical protein